VNQPPPGVYKPITAIDGIVTFARMTFDNDSTFLQGLGVAFSCAAERDRTKGQLCTFNTQSSTALIISIGLSLKYVIHRLSDNQLGLVNTVQSDIDSIYDGPGSWQTTISTSTVVMQRAESLFISAATPALGGASDQVYRFNIDIRPKQ
jgi:hypothetical protein